jgi:hypothetical protein
MNRIISREVGGQSLRAEFEPPDFSNDYSDPSSLQDQRISDISLVEKNRKLIRLC